MTFAALSAVGHTDSHAGVIAFYYLALLRHPLIGLWSLRFAATSNSSLAICASENELKATKNN